MIEAYRLFAYDQGWRQRMRDAVRTGLTAEASVERVQDETRLRVQRMGDPILRERAHDFDDLARLLRHLTGDGQQLPRDAIVVARNMGPAELLDYGREKLLGLALEDAAATSHVAIVARSMGLPLVSCWKVSPTMRGPATRLWWMAKPARHLRPPIEIVAAFEEKRGLRVQAQARFFAIRDLPAVTKDGVVIRLMMNAGLEFDMPHLRESGADGIGLFRTELQSGDRRDHAAAGRPDSVLQLHFRRGGRQAGGVPHPRSWRRQSAALALGAGGNLGAGLAPSASRSIVPPCCATRCERCWRRRRAAPLRILLPMVSDVDEFNRGCALIDRELERARLLHQTRPTQAQVGAMLEVPALAFMLPQLMRSADFVSIGSNDLLSLAFAVDWTNPRVARRYDNFNPASLTLIRLIVHSAAENSGDLSLCGEMAGRPLDAMALLGLGIRTLSMQPGQIGPIKTMIRSLNLSEVAGFVDRLCGRTDHSLRIRLAAFAAERGIVLK